MKTGTLIGLIVVVVLVLLGMSMCSSYNSMVTMRENVRGQWGNVENQYQRRADLIPNLVNTVKGYATHESSTLEAVVEARSRATSTSVSFDDLNEQTMQRFQSAQGELSSALGRLLAISESYPDLKANENFRDLQVQLEGTENRIADERRKFNNEAREYNTSIKQFPRSLVAGMLGFTEIPYFAAEPGAERAPTVQF